MAERLTDTLFSATDGEQVELVGPCDIERAASAGVPQQLIGDFKEGIPPAYEFLLGLAASIRLLATPPSLVLPGHSLPSSPALSALQEPLQLDSDDELLPLSLFPMGTNYERRPGAARTRKELHRVLMAPREATPELQREVRFVDRDAGYVEEEEEERREDREERALADATEVSGEEEELAGAAPSLAASPKSNGAPTSLDPSAPSPPAPSSSLSTTLLLPPHAQPLFQSSPSPPPRPSSAFSPQRRSSATPQRRSSASPPHRLSSPLPHPAPSSPALPQDTPPTVKAKDVEIWMEEEEVELDEEEGGAAVSTEQARVVLVEAIVTNGGDVKGDGEGEVSVEEEREVVAGEGEGEAEVERNEVVVLKEVVREETKEREESVVIIKGNGIADEEIVVEEKAFGSPAQQECVAPHLEANLEVEAAPPSPPAKQAMEQEPSLAPPLELIAFPTSSLLPSPPARPLPLPTTPPPLSTPFIPSSEFGPPLPYRATTPTPSRAPSPAEHPRVAYRFGELYQESEEGEGEGYVREVVEFVRKDMEGMGSVRNEEGEEEGGEGEEEIGAESEGTEMREEKEEQVEVEVPEEEVKQEVLAEESVAVPEEEEMVAQSPEVEEEVVEERLPDADGSFELGTSAGEQVRVPEPQTLLQEEETVAASDDHAAVELETMQPAKQPAILPHDALEPVEAVRLVEPVDVAEPIEPEEPTANDEPDAAVEPILEEASEVEEERIALSKLAEEVVDEEVPYVAVVATPLADIVESAQGESLVDGVIEEYVAGGVDEEAAKEQTEEAVVGELMLGEEEGGEVPDAAIEEVAVVDDQQPKGEDDNVSQAAAESSSTPSSSKSRHGRSELKASHERNRSFWVEILVPASPRRTSASRSPAKLGSSEVGDAESASLSTFKAPQTLSNDSDDEMGMDSTPLQAPRLPSRANKRSRRSIPDDEDDFSTEPIASTSSFVPSPAKSSSPPPVPSTSASSLRSATSRNARPPILRPQSDEGEYEDSLIVPAKSSPVRPAKRASIRSKGKRKASPESGPEAEVEVEELAVEEEDEEIAIEAEVEEAEASANEEAFALPSPPPRTSRKRPARAAPSHRLSRATTTTSATPTIASASFISRLSPSAASSSAPASATRPARERKTTGNWWDIKTALSSLASGKKRKVVVVEEAEEMVEEEPEEEKEEEEGEEAADETDDSESIPVFKAKKRRIESEAQSTPVARKPRARRTGPASLPKGRKLPGWAKDKTWEDLSEVA